MIYLRRHETHGHPRNGRTLVWLAMTAIVVACSSDPSPPPSAASPSVEQTISAGVASVLVSCEGPAFPSGALDGSVDVATPPSEATDELAIELDIDPGLIASSGYRPVLVEPDYVIFARPTPSGERPFEIAAFQRGPDLWTMDLIGACQPRVVLDGTALDGLGNADWWLDTAAPAAGADDRELHVLVHELAPCISEPAGIRVAPPILSYTEAAITITFGVAPLPGAPQDCDAIGGPPILSPYAVALAEPPGERALLDGGVFPPRDATRPPDS